MPRCQSRWTSAALSAATLLSPAATQGPVRVDLGAADLVALHGAPADPEFGDYGIWGGGESYKARFDGAMRFVPYLGASYPHNQPFGWQTLDVACGGASVLSGEEVVERQAGPTRYEYDLGGVIEAYDLLAGGLEQTFVIPERPGEGQDLIVRGRAMTELEAKPVGAKHQALVFCDGNGSHILSYGAATAIDANGRRSPMTTEYADGVITLRLSGAWLEQAAFPVTIDPTIARVYPTPGGWLDEESGPDVVCGNPDVPGELWICYSRRASRRDGDVFLVRRPRGLAGTSERMFAALSDELDDQRTQIACVEGAERIVTVFERRRVGIGIPNVRWHVHHWDDPLPSSRFGMHLLSSHNLHPDISGSNSETDRLGLIVFQHEPSGSLGIGGVSEIRAEILDFDAIDPRSQGTRVAAPTIAAHRGGDFEMPRVHARSTRLQSSDLGWMIAYTRINPSAPVTSMVELAAIGLDGTLLGRRTLPRDFARHAFRPAIAGGLGDFVVSYCTEPQLGTNRSGSRIYGTNLEMVRVRTPASGPWELSEPFEDLFAGLGVTQGGMAWGWPTYREHWVAFARAEDRRGISAHGHTGERLRLDEISNAGGERIVAGGIAFDRATERYIHCWRRAGTDRDEVFLDAYALQPAAPPTAFGTGCRSAELRWSSHQLLGASSYLVIAGDGPGTLAPPMTLVLSLAPATPSSMPLFPMLPGCDLLVDTGAGNLIDTISREATVFGQVVWEVEIPATMPPFTLWLQALTQSASTGRWAGTHALAVELHR